MSDLRLVDLSKHFGGSIAVDGVSLSIAEGEFFSLLGPSGCGKTTTLRMIAGFVTPSSGRIFVGGEDLTSVPPERRNLGVVFQSYAIFPHLTVFENVAYGLRRRGLAPDEIGHRVGEALEQVGLTPLRDRYQAQLSGGQQQRVALARALVIRPRLLILDEPLSALDKNLKEEMKYWIKNLQRDLGVTTVYVTHDQSEALTMSDRIGVMGGQKLVQVGTPAEVYERPANVFVARFIGESNLFDVTVVGQEGGATMVDLHGVRVGARKNPALRTGARIRMALRPENLVLGAEAEACPAAVRGARVVDRIYQGALIRYRIEVLGREAVVEVQNRPHAPVLEPGSTTTVGWDPERAPLLAA